LGSILIKEGQKFRVLKTIVTVNGTLYKNDTVKYDRSEDGNYRMKDAMGRIWFVNQKNVKII
jgi:hypothetical protein